MKIFPTKGFLFTIAKYLVSLLLRVFKNDLFPTETKNSGDDAAEIHEAVKKLCDLSEQVIHTHCTVLQNRYFTLLELEKVSFF